MRYLKNCGGAKNEVEYLKNWGDTTAKNEGNSQLYINYIESKTTQEILSRNTFREKYS